jgi:DNA-binding GntR family transcriptional regulator
MSTVIERQTVRRATSSPYQELSRTILDRLIEGRFALGERTSETDLAEKLADGGEQLSRTPIRIALAELQAYGFVAKRPQVGFFFVPVEADELREIHALWSPVEERIVSSLPPVHTAAADPVLKAQDVIDADDLLQAERDAHVERAERAGYSTGARMIHIWCDRLRVYQSEHRASTAELLSAVQADHRHTHEAVEAGSHDEAAQLTRGHIDRLIGWLADSA